MFPKRVRVLSIIVVCLLAAACASTTLGKSIQAASIQKQLVQQATVQVIKMCNTAQLTPANCAKVESDYLAWASGEQVLADSLAEWAVVQSDPNESKLTAALNAVKALASEYLSFIGQYVDLKAIAAKIGG
ncbi:MAG: hypothetical protein ABSD47_01185 [Candidatus Methylomirabilota bacterium]|jgi:hypothetical protein